MNKKFVIALAVIVVVAINVVVIASLYRQSLAPSDSSASTNVKSVLTLISPTSIEGAALNSTITVSLAVQNTTSISVGEIVLKFDPTVLTSTGINETISPATGEAYVLALNKSSDNTNGKITIDIANKGPGDLPSNVKLVDFVFTYKKSVPSTIILTDPTTTLGAPNQLVASGLGSLTLKFVSTKCGDGATQNPNDAGAAELCDNGATNGVVCSAPYGGSCPYCSTSCTLQTVQGATCGDGTKQTQEQCDSGANNGRVCTTAYGSSCSYCNNSCQNVTVQGARCGDGATQTSNGEQCDNGGINGTVCTPTYGSNCSYCDLACKTQSVTGAKCGDGTIQTPEVCDDGNISDLDACSATCQKSCPAGTVAKGGSCIVQACKSDYNIDGSVDISDFSVFAQNYKKAGIACSKDIIQTGGVCYLDIVDFAQFGQVYKVNSACLL